MTSKFSTGRKAKFGLAAAIVVAGTAVALPVTVGTANAAVTALKLSPATGPASVATAVVSVTGTGFQNAAGVDQVSVVAEVQFAAVACPTVYAGGTGTSATAIDVVSATRILVTAPSIGVGAGVSAGPTYNLCVYSNAATKVLLGTGTYKVYTPPTITQDLSPASGLPAGGAKVTVTGTAFTAKSTAKLGGVAMKSVTYVSATKLTAVVPAGVVGTKDLVVTTEGGDSTATTPSWNDYTYVNAITVSPKTNTGADGQKIVITGSGFRTGVFDDVANLPTDGVITASKPAVTKRAVLFTVGGFTGGATYATGAATNKFTCKNVTVVTDTELVCTAPDLDAVATAYTVVVTNADSTVAAGASVVSNSATYTVSPF
jgi:hypothetical protein